MGAGLHFSGPRIHLSETTIGASVVSFGCAGAAFRLQEDASALGDAAIAARELMIRPVDTAIAPSAGGASPPTRGFIFLKIRPDCGKTVLFLGHLRFSGTRSGYSFEPASPDFTA